MKPVVSLTLHFGAIVAALYLASFCFEGVLSRTLEAASVLLLFLISIGLILFLITLIFEFAIWV